MGIRIGGGVGVSAAASGPITIEQGGTGQTTAPLAINALLPIQSGQSGKFLTSDGTNVSWADSGPIYSAGPGITINGNTISSTIYDISLGLQGTLSTGNIFLMVSTRNFSIPAGATGSKAICLVAPTSTTTFTIFKKVGASAAQSIGTIAFQAGVTTGTFTFASQISFVPDDLLYIQSLVADTTLADVAITIAGILQ